MSLKQLEDFCAFEAHHRYEGKVHIAEWALAEIKTLEAQRDEWKHEAMYGGHADRLRKERDEALAEVLHLCEKIEKDRCLLRECLETMAPAPWEQGVVLVRKLRERLGL